MSNREHCAAVRLGSMELRACCGGLRWALLDAVEELARRPVRLLKMRCGPGEVALDLDVAGRRPPDVVEDILTATSRHFGASAFCFTGTVTLTYEEGEARPVAR